LTNILWGSIRILNFVALTALLVCLLILGLCVHKSLDVERATRFLPHPATSAISPSWRRPRREERAGLQRPSQNHKRSLLLTINRLIIDLCICPKIGSIEGLYVPDHETYAYSASKAALHHLSRHLGGKVGREGIVSNTIACGPFQSKMTAHSLNVVGEQIIAGVPLSRIGTPEDVAGTALFLASRAGAYVNGATIALDGGLLVNMPTGKL